MAEELLVAGNSASKVAKLLAGEYDVGLRQAQKYVARVFESWSQSNASAKKARCHQLREMAHSVFVASRAEGKLSTCVSTLTLLAKMDGFLDVKMQVSGEIQTGERSLKDMTSHQKRKRLAELIEIAQSTAN